MDDERSRDDQDEDAEPSESERTSVQEQRFATEEEIRHVEADEAKDGTDE